MQRNFLTEGPVTHEIIGSLLDKIAERSDAGGQSVFLGRVRADNIKGKIVRAIDYSAYEGMVTEVGDKIVKTVMEESDDVKSINIVHSTGTVKAGEISLLVIVSAGHRKQAMEACSKIVELIKERLPVWKKEVYEDDSYTWK